MLSHFWSNLVLLKALLRTQTSFPTYSVLCLVVSQEKQQRELEEARSDMITVIQAIKSEKYRRDSDVSAAGGDTSEKPKELQDEVTRMREDYESRIAELQQKHEEVLREAKQFRTDVPTRIKEVEVRNSSRVALAACILKLVCTGGMHFIIRVQRVHVRFLLSFTKKLRIKELNPKKVLTESVAKTSKFI